MRVTNLPRKHQPLWMRKQHNCPIQADSGQTCNVQNVFRKQTQSSQYCCCVVTLYQALPSWRELIGTVEDG